MGGQSWRPLPCPPVLLKRLSCYRRQVTGIRPATRWIEACAADQRMKFLQHPPCPARDAIPARTSYDCSKEPEGESFVPRRLLRGSIPAILQQMMVQIDFYRASLRAGATK